MERMAVHGRGKVKQEGEEVGRGKRWEGEEVGRIASNISQVMGELKNEGVRNVRVGSVRVWGM